MQTIHSQTAMAYGSNVRAAVQAQGTAAPGSVGLPSGWWLLPSVVGGACFWGWALVSIFG